MERYYEQAMQSQDMQDEAEQIDEKIEHADRKISEIEALEDVDSEDMTGLEDGDITMKDITVTPELMQQAKQTENPLEKVKEMKNTGILSLVVDDVSELSELAIDTTDDISKRSLYQGNYKTEDTTSEFAEGLFFREYMLREFGNYRSQENSGVLKYAQEYLIAGKTTDKDNLTAVVERLLAVREVVNYLHIRKDAEKIALAHAMAVAIGGVSLNPIVIAVIKEGILAAWAFTDSVEDVRILLNGGRVPFLQKADGTDHGLCYEDYLRIFLYLTGEEKLVMRSLNYMEKDVRLKSGQEQFRIHQRAKAHKWIGKTDGETDEEEELVYITDTGSAYHSTTECPYLDLSIYTVSQLSIEWIRNASGQKYKDCEKCRKEKDWTGVLYVTDYGDVCHSSLSCSGLKRTVHMVCVKDLEGYHACSKCKP